MELLFSLLTWLSITLCLQEITAFKLVGYWGQNGGGTEKDLSYYCKSGNFDIIVIGFVENFNNEANKDKFPSINLSKHCGNAVNSEYPRLYRCPDAVSAAIQTCKDNGKKVFISLGGATKDYGLQNNEQARTLAYRIWNLYLGGTDFPSLRPFGKVVLDGVDLDIEHQDPSGYDGYDLLTKTLHNYMESDKSNQYVISGAPQCFLPEANMNKSIENAGLYFDEIYIQYYNNPPCSPGEGDFEGNFKDWVGIVKRVNPNMKIFVGLPAHEEASGKAKYFKKPEEVVKILEYVRKFSEFAGFMLWDAGFDSKKKIHGESYSKHIKDILTTGKYDPVIPTAPPKVVEKHKVVAYWGQNGGGVEKDLNDYCTSSVYKVVVIGFVHKFFSKDNKWEYPGINLSKHCGLAPDGFPDMLRCPLAVNNAIKLCQTNGKRVYISLGGATKTYGIPSEKYAETLASRIWNLFLGGTLDGHIRPFGAVKLDGIDIDIEHIKHPDYRAGTSVFLKKLTEYFKEDPEKTYYVSGAPQCPYPDVNMKEVLQDNGHLFDELYIQYYNNPGCVPGSGNFESNFKTWVKLATDAKDKFPNSNLKKILVGLPAAKKASGKDTYYKTPEEVAQIFTTLDSNDYFGGFMIWDAGFDETNKIYGQRYSYHINDIMKKGKYDPVVPTEPPKSIKPRRVIAYWGQNGADAEKDLMVYCQSSKYDVIVVAYMNIFYDPKTTDKYPGINLSKHCGWTPNSDYPNLFQCSKDLRNAIVACQSFGKKVMLGVGGPKNPTQNIETEANARYLAKNVWNLFFAGKSDASLRPFGSGVNFDGMVLEIQDTNTNTPGFPAFVEYMHDYMRSDIKKSYFIALSTNCAWPDKNMENILSKQAHIIDELYVRFYDEGCRPGGANMKEDFLKWVNYVKSVRLSHASSNLQKIVVGLPASKDASKDSETYLKPEDLVSLVNKLNYDEFGGILLFDAGFDESNQIVKQRYSNHVKDILSNGKYDPKEPTEPPPRKKIVAYWGQNGGRIEKPLMDYCGDSVYDIIAIGFMHVFFDHRNKDQFPGINLASHCSERISSSYPGLLNCPDVGTAILKCQENGKKVFISMGGATETYGIPDMESAEKLAYRVWNLFLGGKDYEHLRPFGKNAILDGIDLDIEHITNPNYDGYPVFTRKIRELMESDSSRKYYISGAPQCPYPDKNMKGALAETGHLFDEIYIQYYNNYCYAGSKFFLDNFKDWINHLRNLRLTKTKSYLKHIFVGLPTHSFAAVRDGKPYYKKPDAVQKIYREVASFPEFGGFMLWDAGWDSKNTEINGKPYSYAVANILQSYVPTLPPQTVVTTTPEPECQRVKQKKLVVYWGQDGGKTEQDLYQYCVRSDYDTIVIGFVNKFFDNFNSNEFPSFDVSKHCTISDSSLYPNLYRCPTIESAILKCQQNKKKVLISFGGPGKGYGFKNENDAINLATRTWNLFLGGFKYQDIRPFGKAILDGVDMYVKQLEGTYNGYPTYMKELRNLMNTDNAKKYIISTRVTCEHIEDHMKPLLSIAYGPLLDEIYIQYYDMFCSPGNPSFNTNLRKWRDHAANLNKQKKDGCVDIYIGIPAHPSAAQNEKNYKIPERVESDVFTFDIRLYPELGGFMLWNAGWDDANKIKNKPYSYYIKRMLEKYDPKPTEATTTTAVTTTELVPDYFKMAGFWGSNRAFKKKNENDLLTYCRRKAYDVIIMNTLTVFFDDANVGDKNLPRLNFARHCVNTFDSTQYPTYLNCPTMATHIKECQKLNRKILLSLGGGTRWVGFGSKNEAEKFAENLWNLFLGGTAPLRTFGDTVLDGINLDIRLGRSSWFPDFVFKLRELMNSDPKKREYMLTASPVCQFPHHTLGTTFETHSRYFDQLYVSFDDPSCYAKSSDLFIPSLKKWLSLPGPDILIGMPSHLQAAYHKNSFLTRDEMKSFIRIYLSSHPRIRGIALDDLSWDDLNVENGVRFSDYIGNIIKPRAYATPKPDTTVATKGAKGSNGNWVTPNINIVIMAILFLFVMFR